MNIDLTPILQAIIGLLAALITYKLLPWIKAKVDADKLKLLEAVTQTLVFAAEQMYKAGQGAEKLAYVKRELEKRGFTVDLATIEAKVKTYFDKNEALY